jgi:hypothetical protein
MNEMFLTAARRGDRTGMLARLGGSSTSDTGAAPTNRAGRQDPDPPASFDGGVRERRPAPTPGFQQQESAASLFVRAMVTSRQERIERDADRGQTIIANNF